MAVTKVLARDWTIEVQTGTDIAPEWIPIKGLKTFAFRNSKSDADTTTFDSEGNEEHIVASRGRSMTMDGTFLIDVGTGERDPGQMAVETLGEGIGPSSLNGFRLTNPGGMLRDFVASAKLSDVGGSEKDPTSWGAELTVSGKVNKV